MNDSQRDLLNLDDFKKIELAITIENQTTKTSIFLNRRVFQKGQGDVIEPGDFPIYLVELLERGFALDLPPRTCSVGHILKVSIEALNTPEHKVFQFIVKAQEPAASSGDRSEKRGSSAQDRQQFNFEIIQFEEQVWEDFLKSFSKKQEAILELFEQIKGYG